MTNGMAAVGLALSLLAPIGGTPQTATTGSPLVLAQAMIPPTGMEDAVKPMPMDERMARRFPQPVRIGDLIGLPMLDDSASTLGVVRQVVRTPQGKIALIVSYSRWFGWFGHPVAVPLEVVGIEGRQLVSLDMPRRSGSRWPVIKLHDSVRRITFWCLPTCTG